MNKAEKILLALRDHLNLKNYRELADYLDIKTTTIYGWIRNGNIGDCGKVLAKCGYINLEWLETGKGPMMIIDENNIDQLPESWSKGIDHPIKPKITAKIEPGNVRQQNRLKKQEHQGGENQVKKISHRGEHEDWSMTDMIVMTTAVLESKTVYRSALASNVRAFYQAVKNEEEMRSISEKLEAMEKNEREMADRMARMEAMLLSLGAEPKKRDRNTG